MGFLATVYLFLLGATLVCAARQFMRVLGTAAQKVHREMDK